MKIENAPSKIIHKMIHKNGFFPNNPRLPALVYVNCLNIKENDPQIVEQIFLSNGWKNLWRNGVYSFHHYHSNTHEVIGVYNGKCIVEAGGDNGIIFELKQGDVFIIPAGISHKNTGSSEDFQCIGAYPSEIPYDMCYGKSEEHPSAEESIKKVPLPKTDPVYGSSGPLFKYWKNIPSDE